MAVIEISDLKKYFNQVKAVDGINITVDKGEILGFLGPNGAGKTTTISCMLGLLKPTEGTIKINGYDAWIQGVEIKKDLGFIPSDPYFYEQWTGEDHLRFIQEVKGTAKNLQELIEAFEFTPKKVVKTLSTGNKQKLSIIIALMHSPKILIMDEPTRGLDPLLQNVFYKYIRQMQVNGSTIFMSSHNLSEVETICTKVAIIKEGQLVEVGAIKSILSRKVHIINVSIKDVESINENLIKKLGGDIIKIEGSNITIKISGDLSPLLKEIIKWEIANITISNANLEEIFLEFYK